MCVIAYANNRRLTQEEIENGWENNPDGAGFCWRNGNKLCYQKGLMKVDDFIHAYNNCISGHHFHPHVVHFRLATAGGVKPELCHPFLVARSSPLTLDGVTKTPLLFHNGIVSNWQRLPNLEGPQSDSRVLAAEYSCDDNFDFSRVGTVLVAYPNRRKPMISQRQSWIENKGIIASNYSLEQVHTRISWDEYMGAHMARPNITMPKYDWAGKYTSDRYDSKICALCSVNKPLRYIPGNSTGTFYRRGVCNDCFLQLLDTVLEADYQNRNGKKVE